MCVSDEPGYYKDGEYGIRIENVIMVVEHPTLKDHLAFDNLTMCPYERRLIDKSILSPIDIAYIDAFHKKCWETISPLISDSQAKEYLKRLCEPL